MTPRELPRRLPVGGEVLPDGAHFRVFSPGRSHVEVLLEEPGSSRLEAVPLVRDARGYFAGFAAGIGAGVRYRYRLDGDGPFPDPASRFQPEGPHGPSELVDPSTYAWQDDGFPGLSLAGQIFYELHIGTFTPEGTWAAAARELARLRDVGVTAVEVMPVADFDGRFGWGYDGVNLFAPTRLYGRPDDLRRFVDAAHALGLGVILDVVYNHFGPSGNYLRHFSGAYFSQKYDNEWGDALNFDGEDAGAMRELVVSNAGYWIDEFHLDGLRADATHAIHDASPRHILADITDELRRAARGRRTVLVAENESQHTKLLRPIERGGCGVDALWNDDFHHTARVAITGVREAYYTDFHGTPQELVSAAKFGFLYQGQRYRWQNKARGQPTMGVPAACFVNFLENHDQVANTLRGERLWATADRATLRALTALLLLAPGTPLLFQGQEYGAATPFAYFADHEPELAERVAAGRAEFLAQFPSFATPEARAEIPAPSAAATFERCKLSPVERDENAPILALHRDLARLRGTPPFARQCGDLVHGAVLGGAAFVLRFFGDGGDDRLLLVNLGADLALHEQPEPLLAPPDGAAWHVELSTEDPRYGGRGAGELTLDGAFLLPGRSAVVLAPDSPRAP